MNAKEWGDRAAQARAAYIEAAEKVARGDRDADAASLPMLAAAAGGAEYEARKQEMRETWSSWTPAHATHVTGRWTQRVFDDDGLPEEQRVVIDCSACGAHYERGCTSGLVQSHIQRFTYVHLHYDVFHVPNRKVE